MECNKKNLKKIIKLLCSKNSLYLYVVQCNYKQLYKLQLYINHNLLMFHIMTGNELMVHCWLELLFVYHVIYVWSKVHPYLSQQFVVKERRHNFFVTTYKVHLSIVECFKNWMGH